MIFGKLIFKGIGVEQTQASSNAQTFTDGYMSLATIYPEKLSHLNRIHEYDGRFIFYVFGEVILPNGIVLGSEASATEFIDGITRSEAEYLAKCRGVFCIVLYDTLSRALKLISDAFGNLAMHYHYTNGTLCFSTDLSKLTSMIGSITVNNNAILEYLGFGQPLGGKTFFSGIQRVDRASVLKCDKDGVSIKKYHTFSYIPSEKKEIPAILSKLEEEVLASVSSIPDAPSTEVSLSGGFDSRITAAALIRLGKKDITFYTHGREDSHDVQIASQIAEHFDYRHRKLIFDSAYFASLQKDLERTVSESYGSFDIRSTPVTASWQTLPKEVAHIVDSHGGPLLRRQILKAKVFTSKGYQNAAAFVFAYIHSPLLDAGCLNKDIEQEARRQSLASLEEMFAILPEDLGNAIDTFYLDQMCAHRYSVAANMQMKHGLLVHPLLTPKIAELLFAMPSEHRAKNIVPRHLIRSFAQELTRIPLDNAGFRVPYTGYRWMRYFPHTTERFFKAKVRKPIFFPSDIINANLETIRDIILSSSSSYLDAAKLEAILSEHKSGKDKSELLIAITSASILLQSLKM